VEWEPEHSWLEVCLWIVPQAIHGSLMQLCSLYMFVALARYVLFSHTIVTFLL
jgi:hypothetical protein